jgi:hypothetical protein
MSERGSHQLVSRLVRRTLPALCLLCFAKLRVGEDQNVHRFHRRVAWGGGWSGFESQISKERRQDHARGHRRIMSAVPCCACDGTAIGPGAAGSMPCQPLRVRPASLTKSVTYRRCFVLLSDRSVHSHQPANQRRHPMASPSLSWIRRPFHAKRLVVAVCLFH